MKFTKQDTTIIKGIAILLMLYHHLFAFPGRIQYDYISLFSFNQKTLSFFIGDFGKICVSMFIFLGGYGIYYIYKDNTHNLIKDRLIKLYKSYWKVFFIVIPISILFFNIIDLNIISFIENITGWRTSYNGEWWFFTSYVLLILISPIFIKVLNKINNLYSSVILLTILNFIIVLLYPKVMELPSLTMFRETTTYLNLTCTIYLVPSYICGMIFSKYGLLDRIKSIDKNKWKYNIVSIVLICLVFVFRRLIWKYNIDYIYAPVFISCMTILLSNNKLDIINKALGKIGIHSTNIWLIHSFFCYYWCQKLIFTPKISILIVLFLLIISYVSSIIIEKFYYYLNKIIK